MSIDSRKADQEKALRYLEGSIAALEQKLGDDPDWVRCRRLMARSLRMLHYDWNLLPLMPYREYLKTTHWETCRKQALERAKYRCQTCNASDCKLNAHHRSYDRLGNEQSDDLIVLCDRCHSLFHERVSMEELSSK